MPEHTAPVRRAVRSLACLIALIIGPGVASAAADEPLTVRIDPAERHQTMHGWGASAAWWVRVFDNLTLRQQIKALRLLYTDSGHRDDIGIGLDIYRYNLPAASDKRVTNSRRRTPDIETAPFEYDLSRDAENMRILKLARDIGVRKFVLFSCSPPARMTISGSPVGGPNGGPNLRPGMEKDFARYIVDVSELIIEEAGLGGDEFEVSISPINEPQWRWGGDGNRRQEGCYYEPEQVAAVIRATIEELQSRGLDLRVETPESGSWDTSRPFATALFSDPVINENMDAFAIHSYWSDANDKRRFRAWFDENHPGKELRMSEFCHMVNGGDHGIDSGLYVARVIHDDMTIGRVTEWTWWLALEDGSYHDKLLQIDWNTGAMYRTGRMLAVGHYSRFVPPGSVRIGVTKGDGSEATEGVLEQGVVATAFERPDGATALVLFNFTNEPRALAAMMGADAATPDQMFISDDEQQFVLTDDPTIPARGMMTMVFGPAD